jgi:hypothetical protein
VKRHDREVNDLRTKVVITFQHEGNCVRPQLAIEEVVQPLVNVPFDICWMSPVCARRSERLDLPGQHQMLRDLGTEVSCIVPKVFERGFRMRAIGELALTAPETNSPIPNDTSAAKEDPGRGIGS